MIKATINFGGWGDEVYQNQQYTARTHFSSFIYRHQQKSFLSIRQLLNKQCYDPSCQLYLLHLGWMQLVILVYHISGASQNLSIYMFIRLLFTSYLFLNGYGHFLHHWKQQHRNLTEDNIQPRFYEIKRFLTVSQSMSYVESASSSNSCFFRIQMFCLLFMIQ